MPNQNRVHVGTAGWGIPRDCDRLFPEGDSHLERYAQVFHCAEINTSFYRSHRPATYQRWAEATPEHFRFSVKLPKQISHDRGMQVDRNQLKRFLDEIGHLGEKLGPLLVQLPPRQAFSRDVAIEFLTSLRELHPTGPIALEPRHRDWFSQEVDGILRTLAISRVVADPPPVPQATEAGGDCSLIYCRMHGSPRTYYTSYSSEALAVMSEEILAITRAAAVWCIFDNTASGAAAPNALTLVDLLAQKPVRSGATATS